MPPITQRFQARNGLLRLLVIAILYTFSPTYLNSQSADSLFKLGRALAFDKQYGEAITLLQQACSLRPKDMDMRLMLARSYSWNQDYVAAERQLEVILQAIPHYWDARSALADVYLWSKNWDGLERCTQNALKRLSLPHSITARQGIDSSIFIKKHAQGLIEQARFHEAADILLPFKNQFPELWSLVNLKSKKNVLTLYAGYFDFKTEQKDWKTGALEYQYQAKHVTWIANANYANRYGKQGNQWLVQAYPKIGNRAYAQVLMAYSEGKVFPNWTYGSSFFFHFKKYWEAELGVRVFKVNASGITILPENATVQRGGIAYHRQAHRLSYTVSNINGTTGNGFTHNVNYRFYLKDMESYWQASVGTGVSTNTLLSQQFDAFIFNSKVGALGFNYWSGSQWRMMGNVAWEQNQNNTNKAKQNRIIFDAGLGFRF